jgi:hypothetical protein
MSLNVADGSEQDSVIREIAESLGRALGSYNEDAPDVHIALTIRQAGDGTNRFVGFRGIERHSGGVADDQVDGAFLGIEDLAKAAAIEEVYGAIELVSEVCAEQGIVTNDTILQGVRSEPVA